MDLNRTTSSSQIPNTIDSSSPEALFTRFFTDSVIDRIVQCTNINAETHGGGKRKALCELSENSVRINQEGGKTRKPRAPWTRYGCSVCQIHLCQGGSCWEEHIRAPHPSGVLDTTLAGTARSPDKISPKSREISISYLNNLRIE